MRPHRGQQRQAAAAMAQPPGDSVVVGAHLALSASYSSSSLVSALFFCGMPCGASSPLGWMSRPLVWSAIDVLLCVEFLRRDVNSEREYLHLGVAGGVRAAAVSARRQSRRVTWGQSAEFSQTGCSRVFSALMCSRTSRRRRYIPNSKWADEVLPAGLASTQSRDPRRSQRHISKCAGAPMTGRAKTIQ